MASGVSKYYNVLCATQKDITNYNTVLTKSTHVPTTVTKHAARAYYCTMRQHILIQQMNLSFE